MDTKLRGYFFLSMILILLFTTSYVGIYYRGEENTALQNIFSDTGAKFVNSEVYVWCNTNELYKSKESLLEFADQLSVSVGLSDKGDLSKKSISKEGTVKTEITGCTADGKTICITVQFNEDKDKMQKNIVSIDVINKLTQLDINDTANLLKEKFKSFGLNPKVNTCIIGYFDGKLDYVEMNRVSRLFLEAAKAKKVNGMSEKNLISISAYSPLIDNNIELEGKKINMNLALRYNAYEDKTYIWFATPVITIEY